MRRYSIFLLFIIISVSSGCKKDYSGLQQITGSWEAIVSNGGIAGGKFEYPAGNGMIIKFSTYGYERYAKGKLTSSGTYTIVKDINDITEESVNRIIFDNQVSNPKIFITIDENILSLYSIVPDGGYSTYKKLNAP